MSIQNSIGIISNCLNNKVGIPSGSGTRSFTNGTPDNMSGSTQSGNLNFGPGTGGIAGIVPSTSAWTFVGSPSNSVRTVVFDAANLRTITHVSWMPICHPTDMCNGSTTYVSGGTVRTITYFGDQFTIYKLNSLGIFELVTPSLITDAILGKYWRFTATSNDFVVVSSGNIQYHLQFKDNGFYYFQDMSNCVVSPVVLGNPIVTTAPPAAIKLTTPPAVITTTKSLAPTTNPLPTTTKIPTTIRLSSSIVLMSSDAFSLIPTTTAKTNLFSSKFLVSTIIGNLENTSFESSDEGFSSTTSAVIKSSKTTVRNTKYSSALKQADSYIGNLDMFKMPQITVSMFLRVFLSLDILVFLMVKLSNLIRKRNTSGSNSNKSSQRTQQF